MLGGLLDRNAKIGCGKRLFWAILYYTASIYQDRLGTNRKSGEKERCVFIRAFAQSIGFKVGWIFNNEGFQEAYHQDASGHYVSNISFTYLLWRQHTCVSTVAFKLGVVALFSALR